MSEEQAIKAAKASAQRYGKWLRQFKGDEIASYLRKQR